MTLILGGYIKDPRIPAIFSITKISVSKDLHYAHIYFSMVGNDKSKNDAVIGFNSAKGTIQKYIGTNLKLRFTPKLEFRLDKYEEEAYKVDSLLRKISEKKDNKADDNT